jgi:hypothetical protein
MKSALVIPLVALLSGLSPLQAGTEWHTFKSPDGSRSFEAELVRLNSDAGTITVRIKSSNTTRAVKLDQLSEEDKTYAQTTGKQLAAISGFRFKFAKDMGKTSSSTSGDTTITNYDGSYKISIENHSTEHVEDVTIEYLVIWRKDSFTGMGADQLIKGSESISTVIGGINESINTTPIKMENRSKRGSSTTSGGSCPSCPKSTVATRAEHSRDQLVGCIVRLKIGGKVVKTTESSRNLLKKYEDQFDSEQYKK